MLEICFRPRLCENSDAQLACRISISISSMWESIVLATSFGRSQLRKQFCVHFAEARFHTALYEDFRVKCYCNSMSFVVRGSV